MKKIIITAAIITNISIAQAEQSAQSRKLPQNGRAQSSERPSTPLSQKDLRTVPASAVNGTRVKAKQPQKVKARAATPAKKKPVSFNKYSLTLSSGGLTGVALTGLSFEYRGMNWGFGAFGYGAKVGTFDGTGSLAGFMSGVSAHYHFLPAWYTQSKPTFDPGVYATLGISKLTSSDQGELPMYPTASFGFQTSYLFSKEYKLSGVGKMGSHYIYHGETGILSIGSDVSIGIRWDF